MLRTRLWMGAVLVALSVGVLRARPLSASPWYPFLFLLTCLPVPGRLRYELLHLLADERRPPGWLCYGGVAACCWSPTGCRTAERRRRRWPIRGG